MDKAGEEAVASHPELLLWIPKPGRGLAFGRELGCRVGTMAEGLEGRGEMGGEQV